MKTLHQVTKAVLEGKLNHLVNKATKGMGLFWDGDRSSATSGVEKEALWRVKDLANWDEIFFPGKEFSFEEFATLLEKYDPDKSSMTVLNGKAAMLVTRALISLATAA